MATKSQRCSDVPLLIRAATDLYCTGRVRSIALERAAVWLRAVLGEHPREREALRLLGLVELERGRAAEASRAFGRLSRAASPRARMEGLLGLAQCRLARHRPARALEALARARPADLRLRPERVSVLERYYACKAQALIRTGDRRRAQQVLRRTIERWARAGLDTEPLLFELALTLGRGRSVDELALVTLYAAPPRRAAPRLSYTLSRAVYRRILRACRGRHLECCGLLLGRGRRIERIRLLRNRDVLPELACTTSAEQRTEVWRQERLRGLVLLGEFHSHTAGPAVPSRADCAARGRLLVIYSDVFDELRGWRVGRSHRETLRSERALRLERRMR